MKRKLSLVLVAVMLFALVIPLAACGGGAKKDEFRVGMECGYAPFNWTQMDDSNGAVAIEGGNYAGGYDVQIAKKVAEGLGKKLVIVKTSWDGLVPALQSGTIDAIVAGMSPSEERKQTIDFSDFYYQSDLIMVVKKGGPYEKATSLADFSGAKITGQLNTTHYKVIPQIEGVVQAQAMEDFPAMRVALESGIIDGYVSERPDGLSAAAVNPNFAVVAFGEGKGFKANAEDSAIAIGIKKGTADKAKIDEILKAIPQSERDKIMEQAIKDQPAEVAK